jgi:hypothetical protein
MSAEQRLTIIGFSLCKVSPELTNPLNKCPSLALDVQIARLAVSNGLSPEVALENMKKNGPITTSRESTDDNPKLVKSIFNCLNTISIGECAEYPKLAL